MSCHTHLVLLVVLFKPLSRLGPAYGQYPQPQKAYKSNQDEIWQDRSTGKSASIDRLIFDMTQDFQDGGHDVILC